MKDFYRSLSQTSLFRLFSLLLLFTVATAAKAGVVDLGELVPGQEYTLNGDFSDYVATYTATSTGVVYCESPSGDHFIPYADADHTEEIALTSGNQVGQVWPYSFNAEAGKTYYFYVSFVMTGGTFVLNTGDTATLEIKSNSYPSNSTFSAAGDAQIDISFSTAVAVDQITITTGSVTAGITNYRVSNAILSIGLGDILKNWYANGTIKAEQKFIVKITGLRAAADASMLYNGDGVLELTYYAANPPIELTSATNGDGSYKLVNSAIASINFLSYFTSNNADGKYIFTFSEPLNPSAGTVKLQYGSVEAENDYYEETLTPTFSADNKTMTVDVTGTLRRPKDMLASGTNYGQITLALSHLQGEDGQYVYTDTQGGLGSFYFTFPYKEVESNIATEFTVDGSALEIYVSNYSSLEYDGIKFAWYESGVEQSVVVAQSDLKVETDSFGGATITLTIPTAAQSQSDVTISFNNAETADGLNHSDVLQYVLNESMQILKSTPAQGAELASIAAGSTVGVTLSRTDLGYVQYEIWDLNPTDPDDACVSSRATLNAVSGQAGVYTATRYGADLKLVKGHTYRFDVLGWLQESDARGAGYNTPAARASITFTGTTEPFTFSTVKLTSVTPADGSSLASADDNVVTLEFDNLVKIDADKTFINLGMGATMAFESIDAVNAAGEYAKTWALTMSKSFLESQTNSVTIAVVAYDANDKLVEGNQGEEENSYFKFEYVVNFNNPDITFTPESGSTVTSLSSILAASSLGLGRSWDNTVGNISVYKGQTFICNITDIQDGDEVTTDDGTKVVNMTLNLPSAITEAGTYQVFVPAGFFILGEQFVSYKNKEYTLVYTIEGSEVVAPTELNVTSNPANGAQVDACNQIELTFNDYGTASLGSGKAILTKKGSDTVTSLPDAGWGEDLNQMVQSLNGAAASNGVYTVTFPAGYFLLGINEEDTNPVDSPEFSISFIVGEEEAETPVTSLNITSDPANGSNVDACDQIDIIFDDYKEAGLGGGKATISKDGGEAVKLEDAGYGEGYNEVIQPLNGAAAEDGTYVVTFPAGYFILDDVDSPEFTITFTVGEGGTSEGGLTYTATPDPEDGNLEELKTFTLTFSENIAGFNFSNIRNIGVSHDSQITYFDIENDTYSYSGNTVTFTFANAYTEEGNYIINIPASTIFFGDWGDVENEEIYIRYYVGKTGVISDFNVVSDPANGSTVQSCSQIYLTFPDWEAVAEQSGFATISKNGGAAVKLGSTEWGVEFNEIIQPLGYEATEDATYVVTFPAGYFLLAKTGVDDSENPTFTITFTVDHTSGVNVIGVDGVDARYFNLKGIEVKNPTPGMYIIKRGDKVTKEVIK